MLGHLVFRSDQGFLTCDSGLQPSFVFYCLGASYVFSTGADLPLIMLNTLHLKANITPLQDLIRWEVVPLNLVFQDACKICAENHVLKSRLPS